MRILSFLLLFATGLGMACLGFTWRRWAARFIMLVAGGLKSCFPPAGVASRRSGVYAFLACLSGSGRVGKSARRLGADAAPGLSAVAAVWLLLFSGHRHRPAARWRSCCCPFWVWRGVIRVSALNRAATAAPIPETAPCRPVPRRMDSLRQLVHGTRYSELAQITPANAANLQRAWTYHAGLLPRTSTRHISTKAPLDGGRQPCTAARPTMRCSRSIPVTGKQPGGMKPKSYRRRRARSCAGG